MRNSEEKGSAGPIMLSATIDLPNGPRPKAAAADEPADDHSSAAARRAMPRPVLVEDLSRTGFRYLSPAGVPIGTEIRLGLADGGTAAATVVERDRDAHRCEFRVPLTEAQLASTLTIARRVIDAHPTDQADKWPRLVRIAIFIGGGAAAWAAAAALLKGLG
jgi:hypothetical protein